MSKHLLSLMIDELKTVRIICRNGTCNCITEVPTLLLESATQLQCPACHRSLRDGPDDPLAMLGQAIRRQRVTVLYETVQMTH